MPVCDSGEGNEEGCEGRFGALSSSPWYRRVDRLLQPLFARSVFLGVSIWNKQTHWAIIRYGGHQLCKVWLAYMKFLEWANPWRGSCLLLEGVGNNSFSVLWGWGKYLEPCKCQDHTYHKSTKYHQTVYFKNNNFIINFILPKAWKKRSSEAETGPKYLFTSAAKQGGKMPC